MSEIINETAASPTAALEALYNDSAAASVTPRFDAIAAADLLAVFKPPPFAFFLEILSVLFRKGGVIRVFCKK